MSRERLTFEEFVEEFKQQIDEIFADEGDRQFFDTWKQQREQE